jgi:hypothetical protein
MARKDTLYAYSTFNTKVNEWGRVEETIQPGERITRDDLEVSDEEWDYMLQQGVISRVPYPRDLRPGESPNDAFLRQDNALRDGLLDEETAAAVKKRQEVQNQVANNFQAEATALAAAGDDEGSLEVLEKAIEEQGLGNEEPANTVRDYSGMTLDSLKTLAGKREIEGRSNMNQEQLVEAHKKYDEAQPAG